MEHALRLPDSRVLDPRPHDLPRFGVVEGSTGLLPACERGLGCFIEMRRPAVRKRVLRSRTVARRGNLEDAFTGAHRVEMGATAELDASIHFDHHEVHGRHEARGQVLDGEGPTRRFPLPPPRKRVPSTEPFLTDQVGFLLRTSREPRKEGYPVRTCWSVTHDETNHAVFQHVTEHLRRRGRRTQTKPAGDAPLRGAAAPRAVRRAGKAPT